jgi:hypothetical protein
VAKFIIPLDKLPPPYKNGDHYLRFRVTTEDKNSLSQWSQIYDVTSVGQISPTQVGAQVVALQEGGPYEVNWREDISVELPSGSTIKRNINAYDIFVRWSYDADFNFYGRVLGNRVNVFEDEGESPTSIRVVGQLTTHPLPPEKIEELQVFDTGVVVFDDIS